MLKTSSLVLMASLVAAPVSAQPRYSGGNEPVTLSATGTDPCSYGVIADQPPESAVGVYPGYSTELEVFDYLAAGNPVWVCERSIDGSMVGIVYTILSDLDCGVTTPVEVETDYLGECDSGWVEAIEVELLAG